MQPPQKKSSASKILFIIVMIPLLVFGFFIFAPILIYGAGGLMQFFQQKKEGRAANQESKVYLSACKELNVPPVYRLMNGCSRNDKQPEGRYPEIAARYTAKGSHDDMIKAVRDIAENNGYTDISSPDFEFGSPLGRTLIDATVSDTVDVRFVILTDTEKSDYQTYVMSELNPLSFKAVYSSPITE